MVKTIWKLIPRFISWSIWKERNQRVLINETRNLNHSIDIILQNVKQLVLVKGRIEQDTKISNADLQNLKAFNLDKGNFAATSNCRQEINTSLSTWKWPPSGFLKLNFDGASRGNPGPADIGGVLRNSEGEIRYIYSRALGEGTNNEMEFAALEQGLRILQKFQAGAVVVEGDSQLEITAARRMYEGVKASKVTQQWRLAKVTESIAEHFLWLNRLIFQAVRRKANTVADHLANYGIENPIGHHGQLLARHHLPRTEKQVYSALEAGHF